MNQIDSEKYLLDETVNETIFRTKIVPQKLLATPRTQPKVIYIAGQPGAGKTATTARIMHEIKNNDSDAVQINSDFYKPFHIEYDRLIIEDHKNAAPYTRLDGRRWMDKAEAYARDTKLNTVIETTMRPTEHFIESAKKFKQKGFHVELVIMAVPEAQSRLGILSRYAKQYAESKVGRLTETRNHNDSFRQILEAAELTDTHRYAHKVTVANRNNAVVYQNSLVDETRWEKPPATVNAINKERKRKWTEQETEDFQKAYEQLQTVTHQSFNKLKVEVHHLYMQAHQTDNEINLDGIEAIALDPTKLAEQTNTALTATLKHKQTPEKLDKTRK